MDNIYVTPVDIGGIDKALPRNPNSFKQVYVRENLYIPNAKPGIGRLLRAFANAKIENTNIIFSPESHSYGGQVLTGVNLVVKGYVGLEIQYAADDALQTILDVQYTMNFSDCIVLDNNLDPDAEVIVTPYIEDIHVACVSSRKLFGSVLLFLNAEPFKVYR